MSGDERLRLRESAPPRKESRLIFVTFAEMEGGTHARTGHTTDDLDVYLAPLLSCMSDLISYQQRNSRHPQSYSGRAL